MWLSNSVLYDSFDLGYWTSLQFVFDLTDVAYVKVVCKGILYFLSKYYIYMKLYCYICGLALATFQKYLAFIFAFWSELSKHIWETRHVTNRRPWKDIQKEVNIVAIRILFAYGETVSVPAICPVSSITEQLTWAYRRAQTLWPSYV